MSTALYDYDKVKSEVLDVLVEAFCEDGFSSSSFRGTDELLETWSKNKESLLTLFSKHPDYSDCQIATDIFFEREADPHAISKFFMIGYEFFFKKIIEFRNLNGFDSTDTEVVKNIELNFGLLVIYCLENQLFGEEGLNFDLQELINSFFGSKEVADSVRFKARNIKPGMKMTRFIGKLAKIFKWTEWTRDDTNIWNKEYDLFCNASSPLSQKTRIILSVNPLDYLLMSNGNTWSSCHGIPGCCARDEFGEYSSGTLSYMLDGTSFVVYTVDDEEDCNYSLMPKTRRCMFAFDKHNGVLLQSKVYPDNSEDTRDGIRVIAKKVLSECMQLPNSWTAINEFEVNIKSRGTHYKDYDCSRYNVNLEILNLPNEISDTKSELALRIGHRPICPICGILHDKMSELSCPSCGGEICSSCGHEVDSDEDFRVIDGEYYCMDCLFYCEYHNEYEVNDDGCVYVEGLGYYCQEGAGESDDIFYCEYHNEYEVNDDGCVYVEGLGYCCQEGAGESDDALDCEERSE